MIEEQRTYESNLEKLIAKQVKLGIAEYHLNMKEERDLQHKEIMAKLEPIYRVYNSFDVLGGFTSWIFKFVVIPVSTLVAIWYELKHLIINK